MAQRKYDRVLLKVSGEAFCRADRSGVDAEESKWLATEIAKARENGVQLAIVVGGGNIVRGNDLSSEDVDRTTADHMGMLATVINALTLRAMLEARGVEARVMTAIEMRAVAEPYIRLRCIRHLEKGRVVILAAGTGNPFFTTDTAAALRAAEINAQVLLKGTKVDGVYSADPETDADAKFFERLTYMHVLKEQLKVMDATAISLCMENRLPIVVFNFRKPGNIRRAVLGEPVGTLVGGDDRAG